MKRRRNSARPQHRRRGSGRKVYPQYVGRVQMTRDGFIFVIVDGMDQDIFVKASKTRHALDSDTVRVSVTKPAGRDSRQEGEVVEIIKRGNRQFVGYFHTVGAQAWVLMQSKSMPYDIEVDLEESVSLGAKPGYKVAAVVDRWDRADQTPRGHVINVLGEPGRNDTEMHAILSEFNLPYSFDPEVGKAADSISEKIGAAEMKGRRDFRDTLTFTVDPADAKDFDDAISFKALPNGNFQVGVHIADVSWYVRPGDAVDAEARSRGTSVYLVDRTVPMLPEKLCNRLCSLRHGEDKLTFSAVFEMKPDGSVVSDWLGRTVIRSDHRFDYERAQGIIDGTEQASPGSVGEAVLRTYELAMILREQRFKAGAINFDRPEMKVEVDADGKPVRVCQHMSTEANWMIEEWMLLANRTVAEYIAGVGKTFVYRIHDEPNFEKLCRLSEFARGFGYRMKDISDGKAAASSLRVLLSESKGRPEFNAFENIALRCMSKAVYSTQNIGHYGLAFRFYTHFTSPIRRYPDLMVHRLLAAYLAGEESRNLEKYESECRYASERESLATDAERTSIKYKLVEFMQDKVGQEFAGNVSGMTERGMYVEIQDTKIEGMVPLREIRSDFYDFDEDHYRLVGRRHHRVFRLGDEVRIKVKNANLEQRLLDYELVENLETGPDDAQSEKGKPGRSRKGKSAGAAEEVPLRKSSWKRSKIVKSEA